MMALLLALALTATAPAQVTAYTASCRGCSGVTASGRLPIEGRTLACPRRLPLGTLVHLEGVGTLRCEDRGGSIVGQRFDLFMVHHSDAIRWGRRTVLVRILHEPHLLERDRG